MSVYDFHHFYQHPEILKNFLISPFHNNIFQKLTPTSSSNLQNIVDLAQKTTTSTPY